MRGGDRRGGFSVERYHIFQKKDLEGLLCRYAAGGYVGRTCEASDMGRCARRTYLQTKAPFSECTLPIGLLDRYQHDISSCLPNHHSHTCRLYLSKAGRPRELSTCMSYTRESGVLEFPVEEAVYRHRYQQWGNRQLSATR